ncbi:hypothetical protein [Variovorax sp. dw_308]|uniref:hypothetical protein n=1 Tax=Variovorax sp. dw_308 TaxID=2721546 RepID=UPI001C467285|nr:hypothetical protein [Variovorax sp. dw_308]
MPNRTKVERDAIEAALEAQDAIRRAAAAKGPVRFGGHVLGPAEYCAGRGQELHCGAVVTSRADAQRRLQFADSYSRMEAVLGLRKHMRAPEWLAVLGEQWECCDNIAGYRDVLASQLVQAIKRAEHVHMMTPEELAQLRAMPPMLTVYRGCYKNNADGLSWTLDRGIAQTFPLLNRYRQNAQALVLTGTVARDQSIFKNGRNELEIISPHVDINQSHRASPAPEHDRWLNVI